MFEDIAGNSQVKKHLEILLEQNCVPHLLLFCGPEGVGKQLFAEKFARAWIGQSPSDLHMFTPEGKTGMHSIQSIRRLLEVVALAPFNGKRKAVIVDDAERMLPTSANALLKTLEEPPANTLIILVTSWPERLLGTIVSRGQKVRFCPLEDAAVKDESSVEAHFAKKKSFFEIAAFAKEFQKKLDQMRKSQESELRGAHAALLKDAPAAQKQIIEHEIEGALALSTMHEVQELLQAIQAHFLAIERTGDESFNRLLKELQLTKTAIERGTPIQNALESLLLAL